jgi:tripartite-type tricarboxylate transporter receptor subunit TctC
MADDARLIGCNTLDSSVRSRSGALTKLAGVICMAAYLGVLLAGGAAAHEYPTRAIKLVVPYPAGGNGDGLARVVAQELGQRLGQQVIIENKPGATMLIGTIAVLNAPPDGYTLLIGSTTSWALNVVAHKVPPYDMMRDFAPVYLLTINPLYLAINRDVPATSVPELIAFAKAQPNTLNYGSIGVGSSFHLAGELFAMMAHISIVHVPYRGEAPALTDLLANRVQMMFGGLPPLLPHMERGSLRLLGMTASQRARTVPQIPTIAEAALPGYEVSTAFGVFAPKDTPHPIIDRLNRELAASANAPEFVSYIASGGLEHAGGSPEDFIEVIRSDIAKWGKVFRDRNIKLE